MMIIEFIQVSHSNVWYRNLNFTLKPMMLSCAGPDTQIQNIQMAYLWMMYFLAKWLIWQKENALMRGKMAYECMFMTDGKMIDYQQGVAHFV